jgi:hypothetical protein
MSIHYIGNLKWFSAGKTHGRYRHVRQALKAHIRYVRRSAAITWNLDPDHWCGERIDRYLARHGRSRVAGKLIFALPNACTPEEGLKLMRDFLTTVPWAATARKIKGKIHREEFVFDPSEIGIAIHDAEGVGGERNLHAHVILDSKHNDRTVNFESKRLSNLHERWKEWLAGQGYPVMNSRPELEEPHFGPEKLRKESNLFDEEAWEAYRNFRTIRQAAKEAMLEAVQQEYLADERRIAMGIDKSETAIYKGVSLVTICNRLGYQVVRKGRQYMISAPWRHERNPSVSLGRGDTGAWLWYDHGMDEGGDSISFVQKSLNCSFKEAIEWFRDMFAGDYGLIADPKTAGEKKKGRRVEVVNSIPPEQINDRLVNLLKRHRGLDRPDLIAGNVHLYHIKMLASGKEMYLFGSPNISGGVELFQAQEGGFKTVVAPKDISLMRKGDVIIVAESPWDALAALRIAREPNAGMISLNSVSMAQRLAEAVKKGIVTADRWILALDDDDAGRKATDELIGNLPGEIEILTYHGKDPSTALHPAGPER